MNFYNAEFMSNLSEDDDSDYEKRLEKMREYAEGINPRKIACFEMVTQKNNKVQKEQKFYFEKVRSGSQVGGKERQ